MLDIANLLTGKFYIHAKKSNSFWHNGLRRIVAARIGKYWEYSRLILKNVQNEMVSAMISSTVRIVVMPTTIVYRYPHFWWITVIEAIRTSIVFVAPVVLGVVNIRIMVEPVPVLGRVRGTP